MLFFSILMAYSLKKEVIKEREVHKLEDVLAACNYRRERERQWTQTAAKKSERNDSSGVKQFGRIHISTKDPLGQCSIYYYISSSLWGWLLVAWWKKKFLSLCLSIWVGWTQKNFNYTFLSLFTCDHAILILNFQTQYNILITLSCYQSLTQNIEISLCLISWPIAQVVRHNNAFIYFSMRGSACYIF